MVRAEIGFIHRRTLGGNLRRYPLRKLLICSLAAVALPAIASAQETPRPNVDVPRPNVDVPRPTIDVPRPNVDVPRTRIDTGMQRPPEIQRPGTDSMRSGVENATSRPRGN